MSPSRTQYLSAVRTVVVKLGTQLLTDKSGRLDVPFVASVARQVAALRERGVSVTIVSSGAIGAGVAELGLPKRPTDLAKLQAVAAVGQRRLMDAWAGAFEPFKLPVAQLLLTREDIDERTRFLNVRNTIHAAHELGAVPIINENDTISTSELIKITFGDNDILAAMVAAALRADLLVLLTVVDGLLDEKHQPVRLVESLEHANTLVRAEKSALGKGGMNSKLEAARRVTDAGEAMVVADGRRGDVLVSILAGEETGTLFVPSPKTRSSRSRWIDAARPAGSIVVDAGAVRALIEKNRSLLPAGISRVEGNFAPGDVVAIVGGDDGAIIAQGLTNYGSEDVERVRGKKTAEVRALLGEAAYDEVVHRDNLVVCAPRAARAAPVE
ncbi:MAG TPA: glutamate 5-kinase [Tepidisphaeraceae bacterium]|nr:glutamate 5-kinase [Tepidisphaeraceae bacterium]